MTSNEKEEKQKEILKTLTTEEQKNIAEELTMEAINKLEQADEIICELVNAGKLEKHEQNKIYNIILQLKNILNI